MVLSGSMFVLMPMLDGVGWKYVYFFFLFSMVLNGSMFVLMRLPDGVEWF